MVPERVGYDTAPERCFSVSDPSENGRDGVMFPIGAIERR